MGIWGFPSMEGPPNGWFIVENPQKMWMITGNPHMRFGGWNIHKYPGYFGYRVLSAAVLHVTLRSWKNGSQVRPGKGDQAPPKLQAIPQTDVPGSWRTSSHPMNPGWMAESRCGIKPGLNTTGSCRGRSFGITDWFILVWKYWPLHLFPLTARSGKLPRSGDLG